MNKPRYFNNKSNKSLDKSRNTVLRAESRFIREPTTNELVDMLISDKKKAELIKRVRTAEAFVEYVQENNLGFEYLGR